MSFGLSAGAIGLLGVGAGLVGASMSADAAKDAANTQAASADRAAQLEKDMFDKQVELQEPWRQAGQNALTRILGGLDQYTRPFSMSDYQADPGYQFRLEEGMKALDRGAAARGMFNSGRAMKDLQRFSQGLASQEFGAAYDRYNTDKANSFNKLASIAGLGQTAANQTGAAAGAYGNSVSSLITGAGNAQAAGRVGAANAINGGISQGWNAYQGNRLFNALTGGGGGNPYQAAFSNTGLGSSGFGTGLAYGNQDYGQYI